MKTKEEITTEFKADLVALLDKYEAELAAEDHFTGYAECGENVRMTVVIQGKWDIFGNCLREYTEIDLGKYFDGK